MPDLGLAACLKIIVSYDWDINRNNLCSSVYFIINTPKHQPAGTSPSMYLSKE
jgi:hypothetical protein